MNVYKLTLYYFCYRIFIKNYASKHTVLTIEKGFIYSCLVFVLQWWWEDPVQDFVCPMANCWAFGSCYNESPGNSKAVLVSILSQKGAWCLHVQCSDGSGGCMKGAQSLTGVVSSEDDDWPKHKLDSALGANPGAAPWSSKSNIKITNRVLFCFSSFTWGSYVCFGGSVFSSNFSHHWCGHFRAILAIVGAVRMQPEPTLSMWIMECCHVRSLGQLRWHML